MMQYTISAPTTRHDLSAAGFSPAEIDAIVALKARFNPDREYFESNREYERLMFLKWSYATGQIERG
ncbi:hypothetical protein BH23CHL2_BH23CHL2_21880 [soil metagenome]